MRMRQPSDADTRKHSTRHEMKPRDLSVCHNKMFTADDFLQRANPAQVFSSNEIDMAQPTATAVWSIDSAVAADNHPLALNGL